MDYITAKDAAEKWDISVRRVQILLKNGRIDGVIRRGREYMIPIDAIKPDDGRKNNHRWPMTHGRAGREASDQPGTHGRADVKVNGQDTVYGYQEREESVQTRREALIERDNAHSAEIVSSQGFRSYKFHVALCDDEEIFAVTQEKLFRTILDGMNIEYDISVYESAESFLVDFSEAGIRYDLIFLDIFMDGMDGLELAKRIRETDKETAIIFLTSSPNFMHNGFELRAFRYFQKCKDDQYLEQAIKEVYETQYMDLSLVIKSGAYTQRIALKDILSLETSEKKVEITTKDVVCYYSGTLTELLGKLPRSCFVRCHKAFAVNINNIYELARSEAIAKNGKRIPISRPYMNDVKIAFLNKFKVV
jgi:DNA-binding LytR/AlgR family response regulator